MGATIFELLIVLSFFGVLLAVAVPSLRSGMDALAVRAARETAFAMFSRARVIALQNNGAEIQIDAAHDYIAIRTTDGEFEREQYFDGTDLIIEGGSDIVTLRYDAHGLGRMMSRTLFFRTREARAGLTISSFGRVRRW